MELNSKRKKERGRTRFEEKWEGELIGEEAAFEQLDVNSKGFSVEGVENVGLDEGIEEKDIWVLHMAIEGSMGGAQISEFSIGCDEFGGEIEVLGVWRFQVLGVRLLECRE